MYHIISIKGCHVISINLYIFILKVVILEYYSKKISLDKKIKFIFYVKLYFVSIVQKLVVKLSSTSTVLFPPDAKMLW